MSVLYHSLALIAICTTSLYVLAAALAATSQRHWFYRTAALMAMLLVVLMFGAYDLLISLAIMVLAVCGVARVCRQDLPVDARRILTPASQLSLTSMFLLTLLIAVVFTAARGVLTLSARQLWEGVYFGGAGGLVGVVSVWLTMSRWSRLGRIPLGVTALVLGTFAFVVVPSVVQSTISDNGPPWIVSATSDLRRGGAFWLVWAGVAVLLTTGLLGVARTGGWLPTPTTTPNPTPTPNPTSNPTSTPTPTRLDLISQRANFGARTQPSRRHWLLPLWALVVAILPAMLSVRLLWLPSLPLAEVPAPNAVDALAELATKIGQVGQASTAGQAGVSNESEALLADPIEIVDAMLPSILQMRGLVLNNADQETMRRAIPSLFQTQYQRLTQAIDAGSSHAVRDRLIEIVSMQDQMTRGVWRSEFDTALGWLLPLDFAGALRVLSEPDCLEIAKTLSRLIANGETLESIEARSDYHEAHAHGWRGHAVQIVDARLGTRYQEEEDFRYRYYFRLAVLREWQLAATVRVAALRMGRLPETLAELPSDLEGMANSPFDRKRQIDYVRTGSHSFSLICSDSKEPSAGGARSPGTQEIRTDYSLPDLSLE